jgi:phage-related protein
LPEFIASHDSATASASRHEASASEGSSRARSRVFYVATSADAVYVLHAFEKKTRKTTARDLEIGRERFWSLVAMRRKDDDSKK